MSTAAGHARSALAPPGAAGRVAITLALLGLAAILGAAAAIAPGFLRLLFAGAIALALFTLCLSRPRAGIVATFAFLIVLAFIRRLLIAEAGWWSFDPLLLVGPLVATVLCMRLFLLEGRPLARDLPSKLVLAIMVLTLLEVFNPAGGSLFGGVVGFLFLGMPFLWFFVGRELVDDRLVDALMGFVIAAAVVVGLYGLSQTQFGFASWDRAWIDIAGDYNALNIEDQVRGFGTFSSSAEYSLFLGTALAFGAAFILRGRVEWGLALPVIATALFFASARSALVGAGIAIAVLVALRPRRPGLAVAVGVVILGLAFASVSVLGSAIGESDNALVEHQVSGLTDPLNGSDSTLLVHADMFFQGIEFGVQNPLGVGVGVIGGAAKAGGGAGGSTEIDFSNSFVSSGIVGGLLYVALVALVTVRGIRCWFVTARPVLLGILGIMAATAGQWLIGGHYMLAPLTWLLVGYLVRVTEDPPQARAASPPPSPAT